MFCKKGAVLCFCAFLSALPRVSGQTPAPATAAEHGLALSDVQAQRDNAATAQGVDEAARTRILGEYDEALRQLQAVEDWKAKAAHFDALREEAPKLAEELQAKLDKPSKEEPVLVGKDTALVELEQQLANAEMAFKSVQAEFDQLTKEPAFRADRRNLIPELLTAARKRLQESETQANVPPAAGEPPELTSARRVSAQARAKAATVEIVALEKEVQCYDARNTVMTLRQEEAKRRLAQAERKFKALQETVAERRRVEAASAAERATEIRTVIDELAAVDALLHARAVELADANTVLAEKRTGLQGIARKIDAANAELGSVSAKLKQLDDDYDRIIQRVKVAGLNSAVGVLLRKQKTQLPNARKLRRAAEDLRAEIGQIQIDQNELREQLLGLSDVEHELQDMVAALVERQPDVERKKITGITEDLLKSQRELVKGIQRDYDSYSNVLFELSTKQDQLANEADQFADYINEHILWIGGTAPLGWASVQDCAYALRWLSAPQAWRDAVLLMWRNVFRNLHLYVPLSVLLLLGLVARPRLRAALKAVAEVARRKRRARFGHTLEAFCLTIVIGASWPAVLAFLGWRIAVGAESVDQARAVATGILAAAFLWLVIEFVRQILAVNGLAAVHFEWPGPLLRPARRLLGALALVALPLTAVLFTFESQPEDAWRESLGRLSFVVLMVVFSVVLYRLLGLVQKGIQEMQGRPWLGERRFLRLVFRAVLVGLPVVLAVLSLAGYYFTALQLAFCFYWTLLLILGVLLGMGLVGRWLLLTRRALAIEQMRQRRELAQAEGEAPPEGDAAGVKLDLVRIDAQTQRLVRSLSVLAVLFGAWFIWVDVVPALRILDNIRLWDIAVTVEEQIEGETGQIEVVYRPKLDWITASDVGMSLLILFVTIAAIRNLPGLIEITLLRRLRMGAGERYAMLTLMRYSLIGLGVVLAFQSIGVGWAKVQWLVAALGVGLGFGLQEIFANFVSGIILLFERPIRVGDVVTVGEISGRVSQIRIRATTITDWDRKELIVPNKEFITGQLVNWSLSDSIIRVVIPVGIAYGSDTERAKETLERVVKAHPRVLPDPPPQVLFLDFGASSLDFEVRVFSPSIDYFLELKHDLHMNIDKAFREAGIEIAFPQHDIHIRSGLEHVSQALAKQRIREEPS